MDDLHLHRADLVESVHVREGFVRLHGGHEVKIVFMFDRGAHTLDPKRATEVVAGPLDDGGFICCRVLLADKRLQS